MNYDKYQSKIAYPKKSKSFTKHALDNALKSKVINEQEFNEKLEIVKKESEQYNTQKELYYKEQRALKELFKYDLFEEYDVQNNPKKELLYSKASECSEGSLPDIEEWFADLVDLIK